MQEDGTTREGTRENNKNGAKLTILSPGAPRFILRSLDQKESDGLWKRELLPLRSKEIGARQPPAQFSLHKSATSKMRRSNVLFVLERRIKRLGPIYKTFHTSQNRRILLRRKAWN